MSAVYPYHPDRPRNLINTNKLFDLLYAGEDSENTTGTSVPSVPVLTKPARSALIKRRKTKRQVPARLKMFWDEEVATTPSPKTTISQQSQTDSTKSSPFSSSKTQLLPDCLQASPVIDSNFSITLPQKLQPQTPQQRTRQYSRSPQTSFVFSFLHPKTDCDDDEQSTQQEDSLFQSNFGPLTYQHLIYVVCLGALLAFVWTQLVGATTETKIQEIQETQIQSQIDSPYFPSSSFTLTSATLSPSISAVRIFVAGKNQFSFALLRTHRLFAR